MQSRVLRLDSIQVDKENAQLKFQLFMDMMHFVHETLPRNVKTEITSIEYYHVFRVAVFNNQKQTKYSCTIYGYQPLFVVKHYCNILRGSLTGGVEADLHIDSREFTKRFNK